MSSIHLLMNQIQVSIIGLVNLPNELDHLVLFIQTITPLYWLPFHLWDLFLQKCSLRYSYLTRLFAMQFLQLVPSWKTQKCCSLLRSHSASFGISLDLEVCLTWAFIPYLQSSPNHQKKSLEASTYWESEILYKPLQVDQALPLR